VEWEQSKENIQPLAGGRKASKLSGLNHNMEMLNQERQQFEVELRSYDGPDPLDPWFRYISWVEQEYPKGGKEGGIHKLIQSCITTFKDDQKVLNDPRFLNIWLKYANLSTDPLDVFKYMYEHGICTQQHELYESWAWQLERNAAYQSAEKIYLRGIDAMVEPEKKERLTRKRESFQVRVTKRLKGEEVPTDEIKEEERTALGGLRGRGKHAKVGSVRVGAAKQGGPTVLSMANNKPLGERNSQQATSFKIFSDENSEPGVAGVGRTGAAQASLPSRLDRKENEKTVGPWSGVRAGRAGAAPSAPAFAVYEEPGLVQPGGTVSQTGNCPGVLSARKQQAEDVGKVYCPVALFEPEDPTKRPQYCKAKVYQGTTEFSFEEMRALKWQEKERARKEAFELEQRRLEVLEMEQKLKTQKEEMESQLKQQQMAMEAQMKQQQELMARQMAEFQQQLAAAALTGRGSADSSAASQPSLSRQPSLDSTAALMAANPSGRGSSAVATPSPHHSRGPALTQPSPTLNTKEAMAVMQQLWGEDREAQAAASVTPDCPPAPFTIFQEPAVPTATQQKPFQLFTDDSTPVVTKPAFEIFTDEPAVPPPPIINIYCDEEKAVQPRAGQPSRRSRVDHFNQLSDKENLPSPVEASDENAAPAGYSQPSRGTRHMSGVLTQAENVEFEPLAEQERKLDEDMKRQEEEIRESQQQPCAGSLPLPRLKQFAGNQTIALPEEEDFEKMANLCSTPFTGRPAFQFEQDENTCAVNIVYKAVSEVQEAEEREMGPPAQPGYWQEENRMVKLDTIAETSREYRSSSSSSGADTLHHTNKSHWGTTGTTQLHSTTAASMARTPGTRLASNTSSVSGYLGDKSNNTTKSGVKNDHKRALLASPQVIPFDKKLRTDGAEDDKDEYGLEEPTGMFGDMMAEYKKVAQPEVSTLKENSVYKERNQDASLQLSLLDTEPGQRSMAIPSTPRLALYAVPVETPFVQRSGLGANLTEAPPTLNLTGAPPALNLTGAPPQLNLTATPPSVYLTASPPKLDLTAAPAPLELTAAASPLPDLALQTANLSLEESLDPFSPETHARLLDSLPVPITSWHGYIAAPTTSLPRVSPKSLVKLGEDKFFVSECKGEGGYAKVFAATREDTDINCTISGIDAVLKVQKPANDWEFYICQEVQRRVPESHSGDFMSIPRNYSFMNGSVMVSYHQKLGTLLDILNMTKKCGIQKTCIEPMAMHFTIEMLGIVDTLHKADIIHADLKADNFLLQGIPSPDQDAKSVEEMFSSNSSSLQLIDFGRSIDLKLLPAGATFNKVVKTDGIMCTEMKEGRPWRHHIDYYGLAAISYCLLFGSYLDTVKVGSHYEVKGSYKRWWQQELWKEFFYEFINISGVGEEHLPNISGWKSRFEETFFREKMAKSLHRLKSDVMKAMLS